MKLIYSLKEIPADSRVAIYGTGSFGQKLLDDLSAHRPDVTVCCFAASVPETDTQNGVPVVEPGTLKNNPPDWIILCSFYWPEMLDVLYDLGLANILVAAPNMGVPPAPSEISLKRFEECTKRNFIPRKLFIQITGRCNLNCSMCTGNKSFTKDMEEDLFYRILDQCEEFDIRTLRMMAGRGEPTMHRNAFSLIREAAGRFDTAVTTNGQLLDRGKVEELFSMGLKNLNISFTGHDKASYEPMYKGGSFDKIVEILGHALEFSEQSTTALQMVLIHDNQLEEFARSRAFLRSMGFGSRHLRTSLLYNVGGCIDFGTFNPKRNMHSIRPIDTLGLELCSLLLAGVYADGRVTACPCYDRFGRLIVGDINTQTLKEIAAQDSYRNLFTRFMDDDISRIPLCGKCDVPFS